MKHITDKVTIELTTSSQAIIKQALHDAIEQKRRIAEGERERGAASIARVDEQFAKEMEQALESFQKQCTESRTRQAEERETAAAALDDMGQKRFAALVDLLRDDEVDALVCALQDYTPEVSKKEAATARLVCGIENELTRRAKEDGKEGV